MLANSEIFVDLPDNAGMGLSPSEMRMLYYCEERHMSEIIDICAALSEDDRRLALLIVTTISANASIAARRKKKSSRSADYDASQLHQ